MGYAVLAYLIGTILLITWAPFNFSGGASGRFGFSWSWSDLVLNVVMFLPLGFFWQSARARSGESPWWVVGLLGAAFSLLIESGQLFLGDRYSSLFDVATNGSGAALGARVFLFVRPRIHVGASRVSAFALELPLMGLPVLLIPLLWLVGFGGGGTERVWLMLPVALFGGAVLGAVHGGYLEPAGRSGRGGLVVGAGLWFLVAALPGAASRPDVLMSGLVLVMGAAWLRSVSTSRTRSRGGERRVELPTLRLVLPLFAVYLTLSALWPLDALGPGWEGAWRVAPAGGAVSRTLLMQALEYLAAFTLVGYMTAEFHGRDSATGARAYARVAAYILPLVVLLETARGWNTQMGASLALGSLALGAGLAGGWFYHLQRDHIRTLLTRIP